MTIQEAYKIGVPPPTGRFRFNGKDVTDPAQIASLQLLQSYVQSGNTYNKDIGIGSTGILNLAKKAGITSFDPTNQQQVQQVLGSVNLATPQQQQAYLTTDYRDRGQITGADNLTDAQIAARNPTALPPTNGSISYDDLVKAQTAGGGTGQNPNLGQYNPGGALNNPTGVQSFTSGPPSASGGTFTPTGNPQYDALLAQLQGYLDKLSANGQKINPNVQITPEQIAQFTAQAANEVHPYYATQLKAATGQFLGNMGYSLDNYNKMVVDEQAKYGRNLDTLASNSADQGFAQSGIRQRQEGQLANDTQFGLDAARSSLMNSAQNTAASFAQTYGGTNVPGAMSINSARVLPGQASFGNTQNSGLYSLDPGIYNKLIGSQQNAEKQATNTLSSQLQSNYLQQQANKTSRSLNTI